MNEEYGRGLHAERAEQFPAEKPARKSMLKGAITVFFGLAVVIGGLGGAGYWFYNQGQPIQDDGKLPILLPDPAPIKLRPDDPGGMEVPHRNTTVYDQLNDVDPDANVVLQELPDMPRAPEVARTPKSQDAAAVAENSAQAAASASPDASETAAVEPSSAVSAPAINEPELTDAEKALAAVAEREAEAKSAKPAAVPEKVPSSAVSMNDFRIQLASVRDESGASAEWKRLSSKNNDLLGSLQMFVQRTDLGDKGVFYRLQAGPLADSAAAEKLCSDLKQRNVGCLIVRP